MRGHGRQILAVYDDLDPLQSLLYRLLEGYREDYQNGVRKREEIATYLQLWLDVYNIDFTADDFLDRCDT